MAATDLYISGNKVLLQIGMLADLLSDVIRRLSEPSLVQFLLRFALAVPFWRSGILKWDGFLQLNNTAVELFTSEFMLHLPGGPYPFPVPTAIAFTSPSRRDAGRSCSRFCSFSALARGSPRQAFSS
jgi:putative oxidoreductase